MSMPLAPLISQRLSTPIGRAYLFEACPHPLPSVTTILAATRPAEDLASLADWEARVGPEAAVQIRSAAAERGSDLHSLIEAHLGGASVEVPERLMPWWRSVEPFLGRVRKPHLIEGAVYHPTFAYAGTLDLAADCALFPERGEELVLIDWKTTRAPKTQRTLGDYPLQLAAYAAALRQSYGLKVERAAICLALPDQPAQIFLYDRRQLLGSWNAWKRRLMLFWLNCGTHPLAAEALHALRAQTQT
jgi:genome maintenance exonuclease 1